MLQAALPSKFKGITLCLVEDKKRSALIAKNSSLAFRAEKQKKMNYLAIIKQLDGLSQTKYISIKDESKKNTSAMCVVFAFKYLVRYIIIVRLFT